MNTWTVERQLRYKVMAETEAEALAVSRLIDPVDEVMLAWLDAEELA